MPWSIRNLVAQAFSRCDLPHQRLILSLYHYTMSDAAIGYMLYVPKPARSIRHLSTSPCPPKMRCPSEASLLRCMWASEVLYDRHWKYSSQPCTASKSHILNITQLIRREGLKQMILIRHFRGAWPRICLRSRSRGWLQAVQSPQLRAYLQQGVHEFRAHGPQPPKIKMSRKCIYLYIIVQHHHLLPLMGFLLDLISSAHFRGISAI